MKFLALLILAGAAWLGLFAAGPPRAVPATAPVNRFSAERAMANLRQITRAPHPAGSVENARIRDFLIGRLRELRFDEVEVQRATGFNTLGGIPRAASVSNIVARRHGSRSSRALLVTAHYDAVPGSFGAGDDAAGVVAILEAIRALDTGPPLANDLIVLFSDAEEEGLLGAEAFVNQHRWAHDVGVVLNFEGRGVAGPSFMFQTSPGNHPLIGTLASSVRLAQANSLTGEVYRHLPSDTDLSIWLHSKPQVAGLNFAFIGKITNYHSPLDNATFLNHRSLQHHGEYLLPLLKEFGNADLNELHGDDDVYFGIPFLGLVHYPGAWALPLALIAALGFVALVFLAIRRKALTAVGVTWGGVQAILALLLTSGITYFGWRFVQHSHPGYAAILQGDPYNSVPYLAGFAFLTVTLVVSLQLLFFRRATPFELTLPVLGLWSVVNLAAAIGLPGASYLFTWPLVFALASAFWCLEGLSRGRVPGVWHAAYAIPTLLLWPPLVLSLEQALGADLMTGCMVLLAFAVSLIMIPLRVLGPLWRWLLPAGVLASAGAFVIAEGRSSWNAQRKEPDSLLYLLDADSREAWWASFDDATDPWTSLALGKAPEALPLRRFTLPTGGKPLLSTATPPASLAVPDLRLVGSEVSADSRRVRLHLSHPGGARELELGLDRQDVVISQVILNGRTLTDGGGDEYLPQYRMARNGIVLTYFAVPPEGIDIEFTVKPNVPLRLRLAATVEGLPNVNGAPLPERPSTLTRKAFIPTDVTIVRRVFGL